MKLIRVQINKEFNQDKYRDFRNWYFSNHSDEELKDLKNQFYTWINVHQKVIPFDFNHSSFQNPSISLIENFYKSWKKENGDIIKAVHRPIKLEINQRQLEASPFASVNKENIDINKISKQNNYTNLCTQTGVWF